MTTAAGAAHDVFSRIFPAVFCIVRIRLIGAAHPLPTITSRIEETVRTRAFGKAADRFKITPTGAEVRARAIRRFIPVGDNCLRPGALIGDECRAVRPIQRGRGDDPHSSGRVSYGQQ